MNNEKRNIESFIQDGMMEYSGYILLNRCIPDLRDSCKPVIRRILFTMLREKAFKFTKSASISGKVMAIHPHGSCYPAIVGMVQTDNQLTPWLIGKGNFAQHTSRDLQPSADRYSEVKLGDYATEVLKDLNSKSVKWIPNFDGTIMMPEVLPVKFPMILNYCQSGIGVGMASNIPSFNMIEIAEAIDKYINTGIKTNLIPDFATKGRIINNDNIINKINTEGIGSVSLLATYKIEDNTIIIDSIPYSTTREAIIDKVIELIKNGKIKDIISIKDLTGLNGMCIEIVCKKHTNMDSMIKYLFANTPLKSSFSANMNVICDKLPKVMGVWSIIDKWIEWRIDCITKTYTQDISDMRDKLHIYEGLVKIMDYIDEVINIIKNSDDDNMINNIMNRFNIDKIQAEHISELKLKNINKTYISKTIKDKDDLINKIEDYTNIINDKKKIKQIIVSAINKVANKYGKPRQTKIIQEADIKQLSKSELIEEYNCKIAYTSTYIKKYARSTDSQKTKENETLIEVDIDSNNTDTLILFTNMGNRYRIGCHELQTVIASKSLGDYVYNITTMDKDEKIIKVVSIPKDYKKDSYIVALYANGKIAKINIDSYMGNYKKLVNCYNTDSELLDIAYITKDVDVFMLSNEGKALILNTSRINPKGSRTTQGSTGIKLNEGYKCITGIIGVTKDYNFKLTTQKNKIKEYMLDDIVNQDNTRRLFDYLYGRNGNMGNFVYNTRPTNDLITDFEII